MAITVKHKFVSAIPDAGDPTIVQPSNWNDDHQLVGTVPVANGGTGAATLTGYVVGNGTSAMTASSTIPNTDVTGLGTMSTQNSSNINVTGGSMSGVTISDYVATAQKGVANGVATLDGSGTVPISQLPAAVIGALSYQGTWNASTNTPTLTSSVGTKGYYYVVNVAGSTNLNGITDWQVGDWAVYNGTAWQKIDNTDAVTSVNGYTGTVVLTQTDISGTVPTSRTITAGTGLSGGGDLSANRTLAIANTTVTAASYGSTSKTLTATVNAQGQLTALADANIAITNTQVSGLGTMSTQNANAVAITGGTVNGTSIGATTASTGAFTYLSTSGSTSTTPTLSFNASNSPIAAGATIPNSYLQFILQNKSGTTSASTNYVLSNDLGTDSTYYGEFGMNSSVYSSGTPADFFSLNNGIYFSGHDGDLSIGSGNGFKTYFAWGTSGQSAHVINVSGAIGLNTNITGTTNFGTSGQVLTSGGSAATPTWTTPTTGTVTSVAQSFTGGLISVAGSPITSSGTLALTVAGTSGGIPYFSSASTWATSAVLAANALMVGGGAGVAPSTITTGTGVNTALGVNTGTAGAFVVNGGALGTPSSGTVTNLTGTASININGTVGATTATTGAFTTVSATGVITSTLATGTAPFTVASTTQVANLNAATAGSAGTATTATNLAGGNNTTLLGSMPYQSNTNVTTLLSPNTSTTKNFLTQTGTGTNGAVPAWGTIAAADVPTLNQNTTGTAANITASSNTSLTSLANLATVGTIGTGTWNGSVIAGQYGGTGVANTGKTITLGGNLTTSGAFTTTLTVGANTSLTLPASGTVISTVTNMAANPVTGTPSSTTYLRGDGTWSTVTATTATNLAGGALGSIPYQLLSGSTTFLAGNTTTTPQFLTSTGVAGVATAPTLTSSTGSGNVVLATSPTLVTPALGTPSALVGTNITGTASGLSIGGNAATATTATNQSGGTVAATTISASGVITSTVATGTAPFTVASTTAVANLSIGGNAATATSATTATTATTANALNTSNAYTVAGITSTAGFTATSAAPFMLNATTVSVNYTSPANYNLMSAGPITINTGVTVTIDTTGTWVIV